MRGIVVWIVAVIPLAATPGSDALPTVTRDVFDFHWLREQGWTGDLEVVGGRPESGKTEDFSAFSRWIQRKDRPGTLRLLAALGTSPKWVAQLEAKPETAEKNALGFGGMSGLPLGSVSYHTRDGRTIHLDARTRTEQVKVSLLYGVKLRNGKLNLPSGLFESDSAFIEGQVRRALSRLIGLHVTDSKRLNLNGRALDGFTREGADYIKLDDWLGAYGLTATRNEQAGTAFWKSGQKQILLALGTDKIKIGSDWRELGAYPIMKGSVWYVPIAGMLAAR